MKLFRKSTRSSTGRQRLRDFEQPAQLGGAFTYHARRSEADSSAGRYEQRPALKRTGDGYRYWLRRLGLAALIVIVVAGFTNIISLVPRATMVPVTMNGSANPLLRSQEDYQTAADKLLAGSVWNRTKITINTSQISSQMLHEFPELASVSVTLPLIAHRPVVYIQPAQAVLLLNASNGLFVVDSRGKALLSAGHASPQTLQNLVPLTDQSGLKVSLNSQALTPQNMSFIQALLAQLSARHFTVASMTLPAAASELDVQLSGKPYSVKFNLQSSDARQQSGTFLATIAQLQKQGITPAHYVDVRVDGRAYYQ